MSAKETYRFPPHFTLRPAGAIATDRVLARQWTEADPHHKHVNPGFWLEQDYDRDSYLLLDDEGPLFFWKAIILTYRFVPQELPAGAQIPNAGISTILLPKVEEWRAIEMHIQFPPEPAAIRESLAQRARLRSGLRMGLMWLEAFLEPLKVRELYFESINPGLVVFCVKHLGFVQNGSRLAKPLTQPGDQERSAKDSRSEAGRV